MKFMKTAASVAIIASMGASAAFAGGHAETKLRIQTHLRTRNSFRQDCSPIYCDVESMSGGAIDIEMFYSSSVVKSVETFDAAATGILDCDMTGGGYQTGKNPAFQFVGDIMGGYPPIPAVELAILRWRSGQMRRLSTTNMTCSLLVGGFTAKKPGFSSLWMAAAALKDFKFRSPPGMETKDL